MMLEALQKDVSKLSVKCSEQQKQMEADVLSKCATTQCTLTATSVSCCVLLVMTELWTLLILQCDFRFDLFFSFSFSFPVIFSF